MADISVLAGSSNNEQYAYIRLTSSGAVKNGTGQLGGFLVASGNPTVQLNDFAGSASGTLIVNTMQVSAGTPYPVPIGFINGCFATLVGTGDITFFYR